MTVTTCRQCGAVIHDGSSSVSLASILVCPVCSASALVSGVSADGVETVLLPSPSGAAPAGSGEAEALDPYRTGTIVLEAETPVDSAPAVEVKVKGYLTQEGVPPDDADIRLRGTVTVFGRTQGDVQIDDSSVSGKHFEIEERGPDFFVRDLGSSNGTFVNGKLTPSARLRTGDRIQAGASVFTFSVRHTIPA